MLETSARNEAALLTVIRAVVEDALLPEHVGDDGFFVSVDVFKRLVECLPTEDVDTEEVAVGLDGFVHCIRCGEVVPNGWPCGCTKTEGESDEADDA